MKRLPLPCEIIRHLDEHITGHTKAKRLLARNAYFHFLCNGADSQKGFHTLLVGPSGSGKTRLVKSLAESLGIPFYVCNAASLSPEGFVGESVMDMLEGYASAHESKPGIILLDELDKLAPLDQRGWGGIKVQQEFLVALDGNIISRQGRSYSRGFTLNTSGILFVATGAFSGIEEIVQARVGGNAMGFRAASVGEPIEDSVIATDIIEFGLIPELVGRFGGIVELHALTHENLRTIVSHHVQSPLQKHRTLCNLHGIELTLSENAANAMAMRAAEDPQGVRLLSRLLNDALLELELALPRLEKEGIASVSILGIETDGSAYLKYDKEHDKESRPIALKSHVIIAQEQKEFIDGAGATALAWWQQQVGEQPLQALRALRMLKKRGISLAEYMESFRHSRSSSLEANVYFASYKKAWQTTHIAPSTESVCSPPLPGIVSHDLVPSERKIIEALKASIPDTSFCLTTYGQRLKSLGVHNEKQLVMFSGLARTNHPMPLLEYLCYYRVAIRDSFGALSDVVFGAITEQHTTILESEKLLLFSNSEDAEEKGCLGPLSTDKFVSPGEVMDSWQRNAQTYPGERSKRNLILCDAICATLATSIKSFPEELCSKDLGLYLNLLVDLCGGVRRDEALYLLLSHFDTIGIDLRIAIGELSSKEKCSDIDKGSIHILNALRHFDEGSLRVRVFENKPQAATQGSKQIGMFDLSIFG